jgi:poly(A) polymerase
VTAVPPRLARYFEPTSAPQQLSRRLADAGHRAYLVGGSVRDAFLDRVRPDSDTDIATDARPDVIARVVEGWADAVWLQGERFGTVGCEKNGERFEITTFRAEIYQSESRKPIVTFSDDIATDLSRRDFTINAVAIALDDPDLVDPYGGLDDLVARRLRTPLSPEISFGDDPLRMLRAARFVATLRFDPDPELLRAVEQLRERLRIISAERIRDELSKLLLADDPSPGLWLISRTRLSDEFLPELNAMELEQDPIHTHKDVLAHTIAVVAKTPPRLKLRLAAL